MSVQRPQSSISESVLANQKGHAALFGDSSPEDLATANADQDALAAFLDERGIRYTRDPGADGVSYVEWDMNDDAANEAVAVFFAERYPAPEVAEELDAEEESASCVGMIEVGPG